MPSNYRKLVEERISKTGESWATAATFVRAQATRGGPSDDPAPERADTGPPFNRHPAHQGFFSSVELGWVMDTASSSKAAGGDREKATYTDVYTWLVEYRGGTEVPLPSYKMVRDTWDLHTPHREAVAWAKTHVPWLLPQ